jgi:para-aminobenzoate synthetase component I
MRRATVDSAMKSQSSHDRPRLRRLALAATPEEIILQLQHLPGLAWLDTAGNNQQEDEGISILAAEPTWEVQGNIFTSLAPLRACLERIRISDNVDQGLPCGGLIGGIEFDGSYHFAYYPEMLVHRHRTGEWWSVGDLLDRAQEGSQPPCPSLHFEAEMTAETFCERVERARSYIAAGDIYQVNLTHRWQAPWPEYASPLGLYLRLREVSPAPYAAFLDQGHRQILSSSPESFLKMTGALMQTRPIKGTRPRFRDGAADQKSMLDLITSEKERAELLMITDLERNDLGSVAEFGSVCVPELLKLERFAQVFHLVSTVQATLRPGLDHLDALQACFPGGSITGAPKRRAREIITELESASRGLYTGAIGYLGSNGESHFNIAIRTIIREGKTAHFHVGAGIVADSQPQAEWEETLHKASGMLAAAAG